MIIESNVRKKDGLSGNTISKHEHKEEGDKGQEVLSVQSVMGGPDLRFHLPHAAQNDQLWTKYAVDRVNPHEAQVKLDEVDGLDSFVQLNVLFPLSNTGNNAEPKTNEEQHVLEMTYKNNMDSGCITMTASRRFQLSDAQRMKPRSISCLVSSRARIITQAHSTYSMMRMLELYALRINPE